MNIAIITGASSGFGKEYVKQINEKYQLDEIWVIARRLDRLKELQNQYKTPIRCFGLDLTERKSWEKIEKAVKDENANIKVLVNNAGFGLFAAFQDGELDTWLNMIDLNDKAMVGLTHLLLPYMSEGSEIINMASMASYQPIPYIDIYGATKAFVLSFSRALNVELKPRKIKSIAVCPFWTKTEFFDVAVKDESVIKYYSHYNTIEKVVTLALKNIKKGKDVSISDFVVKLQRFGVKILPTKWIMKIWCKQQEKPTK